MSLYQGVPNTHDSVLPMYTLSSPSPYSSSSDSPIDGRDEDTIKGDDLDQLFGGDTILVDGSSHLVDDWSLPQHEQIGHKIAALSRGSGYTATGNYESPNTPSTATSASATSTHGGNGGHMMSIVLLHKPRGSKGVWYPIAQGDHIRVTKGKGKRLKLEVRSSADLSQDIVAFLVLDGSQLLASGSDSGLIVESVRNLPPVSSATSASLSVTELSLKLSRLSRRISILVRAKTRDASPFQMEARSIEFSAHNNGKESVHNVSVPPSSPLQQTGVPPPTSKDIKFMGSSDSPYSRSASPPSSNQSPVPPASPKNTPAMVPVKFEQMPASFYHQQQMQLLQQQQQLHQQAIHGQYYTQPSNLVVDQILPVQEYPERVVPSESESERKRKRLAHAQDNTVLPSKVLSKASPGNRLHGSFNTILVPSNSPNSMQPPEVDYNDLETVDGLNYNVFGEVGSASLPLSDPNSPQTFAEQQHQQQQLHQQLQQQLHQQLQLQHQLQQQQSHLQTQLQHQVQPPPLQAQPQQPQQVVQGGLDVKGIVRAQGFLQYSDARLKTDITDLADALSVVSALEGKSYRWKHDQSAGSGKGSKRVIGLIAQEVQKILPEVVHEIDGYLSVAYSEIVPVLIEALKQHLANDAADKQEVQQQIRELDHRLQAVTNEQDQWKSCYHTMAAMRVLSLWGSPYPPLWSPPPPPAPFNHPQSPAYSHPQNPAYSHPPTPSFNHSQKQTSPAPKASLLNGIANPPVMSYQQQYTPHTAYSQPYATMDSKTQLLPKQQPPSTWRHWFSVLGFMLGMCMSIIGIVLLLKPSQSNGGPSTPNSHMEISVVLLGLGVVCMISVSIFYFCSKIHKNFDSEPRHVVNV